MFRFTIRDVLAATGTAMASGLFGALAGVNPLTTIYFAVGGNFLGCVGYFALRQTKST